MIEFNNSQRLGLDLDRHIALDAGAGTGKTTVMAERYVQHLIASEQRATHVTPCGPRIPLSGHGSLRAPKRERTSMEAWPGLLPRKRWPSPLRGNRQLNSKVAFAIGFRFHVLFRRARTMSMACLTLACETKATLKCCFPALMRRPFPPLTPS